MERRSFVRHAGLAGVLAAGSAPALVNAQQKIRWRLASSFPKQLDSIYGAAETVSKKLAEMSGGAFQLTVYASGEIVPPFNVMDAVSSGTVECGHTASYYYWAKNEAFALSCAIPFGMTSRQLTAWMMDGNGLKLLRELFAKQNIVNFPCGNTGAQMGGWYRKEIKSAADMKGMKMRIGGFSGKVLERLGAIPQSIAGADIYQALEKGTIDAAEWVGPYDDEKLGFAKVAPYYYYPGWWEGGAQLDLYVNSKAYNALSAEYKAMLEVACSHAHVNMQARYDARNGEALLRLVRSGAKPAAFPKDVMDAAYAASRDLYKDIAAKNSDWQRIHADYQKFFNESNVWFNLCENRYSQFLLAQRPS